MYLCPECSRKEAAVEPAGGLFGGGLSKALYYVVLVIIVVMGAWYVYVTFVAPTILPSPMSAPSASEVWSRYSLLISVSVGMFMIVLVGGELMLRTGPKQPRALATQPHVQPASRSVRSDPSKSPSTSVTHSEVAFDRAGRKQSRPVSTHAEVQPLTQTLPTGPKSSQPAPTQPDLQPRTQSKLVYCIYCGGKIPLTAVFCDKCGKGQQ